MVELGRFMCQFVSVHGRVGSIHDQFRVSVGRFIVSLGQLRSVWVGSWSFVSVWVGSWSGWVGSV